MIGVLQIRVHNKLVNLSIIRKTALVLHLSTISKFKRDIKENTKSVYINEVFKNSFVDFAVIGSLLEENMRFHF